MKPITTDQIRNPDHPLTCLTCYDYLSARVMDQIEPLDMILVGDSLGMVVLGYENTLEVTLDDMIHHSAAVSRGTDRAYLVTDLPYLEMARDRGAIVESVRRLVQEGGAQAVKIEGGEKNAETVAHLSRHDVPIVGHLGLTPQSVEAFGGYRIQARDEQEIRQLGRDARALQDAGIIALVLECVPSEVAARLTDQLDIPTIGIGAGAGCQGQVLVWQDMMGLTGSAAPSFVRQWGDLESELRDGVKSFCEAVRNKEFPSQAESFQLSDEINSDRIDQWLDLT